MQEALLRAWRSRDVLKNPGAARARPLTIVRREHARLYERKRLELVPLDDVAQTRQAAGPQSRKAIFTRCARQAISEIANRVS